MMDLLGAMAFKAVSTALKLDVFEVLSDGPLAVAETARKIEADERGAEALLKALDAIGYVEKQEGRYANTPMTAKWMVRSSPNYIANAFRYFEGVLERWGYLDEAICQGQTPTLAWE